MQGSRLSGLWLHPDFRRLWAGQTISAFGSQVTLLALPLVAILTLGATPTQMGLLGALGYVPFLLVGLFAGAWVDRFRRRPILIGADLGRAAILGSVPLAAAAGLLRIEYLYAVAFLSGLLSLFADVAYSAFVPCLVRREELVEAISKLEASRSAAMIAGPGLGGALVQALTAPLAIAFDALSFAVSAGSVWLIRAPEPEPERAEERQSVWGQIAS